MKNVFPLGCVGLVFIVQTGWAESQHGLQAELDVGAQSVRDDTLVPLAHTGPRLTLASRYYGDLPFALLLADGHFGTALVIGAEGELGLTFSWGFHLSPLFSIHEDDGSGLVIGPVLGWDNDTFYFGDWDDAHGYWIGARWLGPRVYGRQALSADWRVDWASPRAWQRSTTQADDFRTRLRPRYLGNFWCGPPG